MTTHSSILAGKSQGRGAWRVYTPWGHKESDMTEQQQKSPYHLEPCQILNITQLLDSLMNPDMKGVFTSVSIAH